MSWATALASRPSGTPAASTTCQSWLMSSGVAVKVFMSVRCLGVGSSKLGQTETDSQDTRRAGHGSRGRLELHEDLALLHRLARPHTDRPDGPRSGGAQLVLHLHRLQDHDPGTRGNTLPRFHLHPDDQ